MKDYTFFKGCLISILITILCIGLFFIFVHAAYWLPIDQATPNLAPPGPVTHDMAALAPASIQNVEEIFSIQSSGKPDEIVALHQSMNDMDLLVVHESGLFHRWGLETEALEAEYKFSASRRTGVSFNADGSQVVTPGMLVSEDLLYGYSLWDVKSGEMLACRGDHCPNPVKYQESWADKGLALSPNGEWIVDYRGSTLKGNTLHRNIGLSGIISIDPNDYDMRYYTIDHIAFDKSSAYIAIAMEEGILRIHDVDLEFLPKSAGKPLDEVGPDDGVTRTFLYRHYGKYNSKKPIRTSDLAIDDTRTWLARLTDKELIIYDLRKRFFPRHLKVPISNGNLLAFNHSGNLLTVATDDEILMFDIAKRKQVASFDVGEATALFFTHDDRLLTWGDADGVIHIWGVGEK